VNLHAMTPLRVHSPMEAICEPPHVSRAYAAAAIELYGRLWHALEQLAIDDAGDFERIETALVILRLELVVLLDACDSPRWRNLLRAEHRIQLEMTLWSVLRILSESTNRWSAMASRAQDRLFEAVLTQCSCSPQLVQHGYIPAFAPQLVVAE
jgi:hypothetical protein